MRHSIADAFNAMWRFKLEHVIDSDHTLMPDQIIHYPAVSNDSRYTFSLFAFPEDQYAETLTAYTRWIKDYDAAHGYRVNLLHVGYRIAQDQQALLSYSRDGGVMTIDPVSTANAGWREFLTAYNGWCSARGGVPLLNQTFGLTREIVQKAFGDRLDTIAATRKTYDPGGRLLNDYFKNLFGV